MVMAPGGGREGPEPVGGEKTPLDVWRGPSALGGAWLGPAVVLVVGGPLRGGTLGVDNQFPHLWS